MQIQYNVFYKTLLNAFFNIKCCFLISLKNCLKGNNVYDLKLFCYVERLFPPYRSHCYLKNNTPGNVLRIVCVFFLLPAEFLLRYLRGLQHGIHARQVWMDSHNLCCWPELMRNGCGSLVLQRDLCVRSVATFCMKIKCWTAKINLLHRLSGGMISSKWF